MPVAACHFWFLLPNGTSLNPQCSSPPGGQVEKFTTLRKSDHRSVQIQVRLVVELNVYRIALPWHEPCRVLSAMPRLPSTLRTYVFDVLLMAFFF